MNNSDYAYAVARIRAKENSLLSSDDLKTLLSASLEEEKGLFLLHGWENEEDINILLKRENEKLFKLLAEVILNKDLLSIFTVKNDFHNIKACLKCNNSGVSVLPYLLTPSSIDGEKIQAALKNRNFFFLKSEFSDETKRAFNLLYQTGDEQNSEIILDKAALCLLKELTKKSKCDLLKKVCELICCVIDIKIAYRCALDSKSKSFCKNALCECSAFDIDLLSEKCAKGEKEVLKFFENTKFQEVFNLCLQGTAQLENYLDIEIEKLCKSSKLVFLGIEPIVSYYFSKQAEFRKVRLILTLKRAGFSKEKIEKQLTFES